MFQGTDLPTHKQRILQLDTKYQWAIDNGIFKPYVYPLGSFGAFLVILYFLITYRNRPFLKSLRFLVWFANLLFSIWIIRNFRVRKAPIDYGIGLITWWFVLWTTTVMIAHDGQEEFARIERAEGATRSFQVPHHGVNGHAGGAKVEKTLMPRVRWQQYPTGSMLENVDWVFDLLSNFRGMSWNWRIASLPGPPEIVRQSLKSQSSEAIKEIARPRPAQDDVSHNQLLKDARKWFIIGYLCLDFLRTIIIHDPYYRGLGSNHKIGYLPQPLRDSPAFHQAYRLVIGLGAVYWALATIFTLAPLFFCGVLGAHRIGVRGEPWMYPREWGSFTSVLDRGLAGWWGIWWHQTFRFAFEAPSRRLIEVLKMDRRSIQGKALQLLMAFALSGSIHACGSYTSIGNTRPIRGPFAFFIVQPMGIMGQAFIAKALQRAGITERLPTIIRRAARSSINIGAV